MFGTPSLAIYVKFKIAKRRLTRVFNAELYLLYINIHRGIILDSSARPFETRAFCDDENNLFANRLKFVERDLKRGYFLRMISLKRFTYTKKA